MSGSRYPPPLASSIFDSNHADFSDMLADAVNSDDVVYSRKIAKPRPGFKPVDVKIVRHKGVLFKFSTDIGVLTKEAELMRVAFEQGVNAPEQLCFHNFMMRIFDFQGYSAVHIMEEFEGETLDTAWPRLSYSMKKDVAFQVARVGEILRTLRHPDGMMCGWSRGNFSYSDREDGWRMATVYDVDDFHVRCKESFLNREYKSYTTGFRAEREGVHKMSTLLAELPTDSRSMLAHGDLVEKNLILQKNGKIGVVSWQYAGLMPEYWDFLQIQRSARYSDFREMVCSNWPVDYTDVSEKIIYLIGRKSYLAV